MILLKIVIIYLMRCKVELSNKILMRYFWISLGCISFILGTIGIILPLLPTVPFYLLTLYCFSKGSQRLHQWFRQTDLYKKHLADFVQKRTMSIKAKFKVLFMVTVIMSIGYYFMPTEFFWVQYVMLTVWIIHIIYLFWGIKTEKI